MSRKRALSPTIWDDPAFGRLSPYARLLFIGLVSMADDDGRQRGDKYYLKSNFFKRDKWGPDWVDRVKEELRSTMKNVIFYEVSGEEYIQLMMWEKYQKQQKDRRLPSQFPPPDGYVKQVSSECLADDEQLLTKVKLSKVKLSKEGRFAPPSLEDVKTYCRERGNSVSADGFISFYESKGWLIGKNRMKDWRAAVRTWEQRSGGRRLEVKKLPDMPKISEEQRQKSLKILAEARSKILKE